MNVHSRHTLLRSTIMFVTCMALVYGPGYALAASAIERDPGSSPAAVGAPGWLQAETGETLALNDHYPADFTDDELNQGLAEWEAIQNVVWSEVFALAGGPPSNFILTDHPSHGETVGGLASGGIAFTFDVDVMYTYADHHWADLGDPDVDIARPKVSEAFGTMATDVGELAVHGTVYSLDSFDDNGVASRNHVFFVFDLMPVEMEKLLNGEVPIVTCVPGELWINMALYKAMLCAGVFALCIIYFNAALVTMLAKCMKLGYCTVCFLLCVSLAVAALQIMKKRVCGAAFVACLAREFSDDIVRWLACHMPLVYVGDSGPPLPDVPDYALPPHRLQ